MVRLADYVQVRTYIGLRALGGATLCFDVACHWPHVLMHRRENENGREGKGTLFQS
jgi:hypothetical protein